MVSYTPGEPVLYAIRVQGHLDDRWSGRFGGLALEREDGGTTLLHGELADQSALHGVLNTLRDLGLPILSVQLLDSGAGHR